MPSRNTVIIAAAGSGKTARIIKESLENPEQRTLITTFTRNNENQIRQRIIRESGSIPKNIHIQTWFTFLLRDFVRPYQKALCDRSRIGGLVFVKGRSALKIPETNTERHYFGSSGDIYSDKISKFGVRCNERTEGRVVERLSQVYDHIYIDEIQDLAAWDLDILEILFQSDINVTLVGDHRQSTYKTNNAIKYKKYAGINIIKRFREWEANGVVVIEEMTDSYRCRQEICDFSDSFFPSAPRTTSRNTEDTGHDGVFTISVAKVSEYYETYRPSVLRYSRRTDCDGLPALNFGDSKGLQFDRILIFPHGPFREYMRNGDASSLREPSYLYVASTRAKYSVAIVYEGDVNIEGVKRFEI